MSVLQFLIAIVLPPVLMLGWAMVQTAWRRQFGRANDDADVLAARGDCGSCTCTRSRHRSDLPKDFH